MNMKHIIEDYDEIAVNHNNDNLLAGLTLSLGAILTLVFVVMALSV